MAEWLREVSVGEWYQADGEPFEIIGVDAKAEVVLVQHFEVRWRKSISTSGWK